MTQLLAELTRGVPNHPALRAVLDELLAAALPRIVDLAITGPAELADLASLALQLAPQPDLAAPLASQMPEHSVRLSALAATLASQQVTHYRAGASDGEPDAADRLAGALNKLSLRLADVGQREEALAAARKPPPSAGSWPRPAQRRTGPAWPGHWTIWRTGWPNWDGGRRRWLPPRKPPPSAGSWPRPAQRRSGPAWPGR